MKRKLGWFGLGFAGAELAAAILPPLVCVPAAAFLVCLALLWIKRRRDSAIPVLGALCGLAWFLVFTLVWVRPVKARAGQTVTCTAVVETDADASYSESRLRGTLRLTEIDGRAANVKVQCASFPGESAGERFIAKFALTELPDNKYRLSRQSKGVYFCRRSIWAATTHWTPAARRGLRCIGFGSDGRPHCAAGCRGSWTASSPPCCWRTKAAWMTACSRPSARRGVSHLLAVSGLHLALLCGLLGFGRKWKFYKPLILLRAAAALFYLLLTGMPVSVSRAGIVLLVALVGDFFLLPPDLLTSTSFAAILLGLQNAYAPCDLGFQLSFCAVLGVQAAAALARTEQRAAQDKPAAVKALCQVAEPVQTAVLASLGTLPVLVAHGMAASLVGVLCNLLVVWMVQPALQLGILLLVCSAVPLFGGNHEPDGSRAESLAQGAALAGTVLRRTAVCVDLSAAAVHAVCAGCAGRAGSLLLACQAAAALSARGGALHSAGRGAGCLDAARCCADQSGRRIQQSLCRLRAERAGCGVLPRRGEQLERRAELSWAGRSRQEPALVVDLRAKPTQMELSAAEVVTVQELADFTTRPVLDGLTLDLYHNKSANLAVLGVGGAAHCRGGRQARAGRAGAGGCPLCTGHAVRFRAARRKFCTPLPHRAGWTTLQAAPCAMARTRPD